MKRPAGFTLVELVMVLVLLGIVGVIGLAGVYQMSQGYAMVRENAAIAAKAQIAMLRMIKEFTVIKSVANGSANAITFTGKRSGADVTHTISLTGSALLLDNTAILADRVNGFTLSYYSSYNSAAAPSWSAGAKIIEITLIIGDGSGNLSTFTSRVAPRNL